jgi:hypothetical protein
MSCKLRIILNPHSAFGNPNSSSGHPGLGGIRRKTHPSHWGILLDRWPGIGTGAQKKKRCRAPAQWFSASGTSRARRELTKTPLIDPRRVIVDCGK